jgi:hypothetical protein
MKPESSPVSDSVSEPTYDVGYGKPPKATQFQPGQSGNEKGRPKGQPGLHEVVLSEAARIVKVKLGEEIVHLTKKQIIVRRLFELAAQGNLAAARLILDTLAKAEASADTSAPAEQPLTEDELALLKEMMSGGGPP